MRILTAKIMINLTASIWRILLRFFIKYKVIWLDKNIKNLEKTKPLLIISNHATWADPFILTFVFPNFSKIFPVRWVAAKGLFQIPILGQIVWLYGSFVAKRGMRIEKALKKPLLFLKKNGTIGIFPEGRRRKTGRPRNARRGAAYLALHSNALILPMYIRGAYNTKLWDVVLRRRTIGVVVGIPFTLSNEQIEEKNLKITANFLMQKVRNLKNENI